MEEMVVRPIRVLKSNIEVCDTMCQDLNIVNVKDRKKLEEAARQWIIDNEGEIEVYDAYITKDQIDEDIEDVEEWLMNSASEYSTGFTLVEIKAENGFKGVALITVDGSSWEGLDVDLGGVFESEGDARAWIKEDGYIL